MARNKRSPWAALHAAPGGRLGRAAQAALLCLALHAAPGAAQTAAELADRVHSVQPGETLFALAARYTGSSEKWSDLQRYNRIADPYRIAPGTTVRIPAAWLAVQPSFATAAHVSGEVRAMLPGASAPQPVKAGDRLPEGSQLEVGTDGYLRLELQDRSVVRIPANSRVRLDSVRVQPASGQASTAIRLDAGRVDASARSQRGPSSRFEVRTPLAVASVRGTEFGVGLGPDAAVTGEVTHGVVDFAAAKAQPRRKASRHRLHEGEGARVDPLGELGPVRPLPAAPDLAALPATLGDADFVRLAFAPGQGAAFYRVRIAQDAELARVLRNGVSNKEGRLQLAALDDGNYTIGVRAVDDAGLAGRESVRALRIKAHPVAPLAERPAPAQVVVADAVELAWAQPAQVQGFHLQLSAAEDFGGLLVDEKALREGTRTVALPPGRYHWRVASVRELPDGALDEGPFGGARSFEMVAPPPMAPPPSANGDDGSLQVHWAGRPGERYLVQVALDEGFAQLVFVDTVAQASARVDGLAPGTYFVRLRTVGPDGEMAGRFSPWQSVTLRAVVRDAHGGAVLDAGGRALGRQ